MKCKNHMGLRMYELLTQQFLFHSNRDINSTLNHNYDNIIISFQIFATFLAIHLITISLYTVQTFPQSAQNQS